MKASVIIPVRVMTRELREAVPHLLALQPAAHEIIVVPDHALTEQLPASLTVVPKPGGPAAKRDFVAGQAGGDVIAFLDDDAYPRADWLANALPHFADQSVAAVGGPAITPPGEGLWAAVSGAVFTSWLGSGPTRMRYWPTGTVRSIDDWPSVNLLVRKNIFDQIGGFDTAYWPGEDTKLCLDLVQAGYRIMYDPGVVCYHHRATTPLKHLKQVARYGLHRGHFVRKFPATSRRLSYCVPSLALAVLLVMPALAVAAPASRLMVAVGLAVVALVVALFALIEAWRSRRWPIAILYPWLLSLTHLTYSIMFIRGLFSPELPRYSRSAR